MEVQPVTAIPVSAIDSFSTKSSLIMAERPRYRYRKPDPNSGSIVRC
jgi:hypothetical protein